MEKQRIERQYLSVKELSQYAGISVHTLYLWVQLRKIPYRKIGKLVRFKLTEIEGWLEDVKVEAK